MQANVQNAYITVLYTCISVVVTILKSVVINIIYVVLFLSSSQNVSCI